MAWRRRWLRTQNLRRRLRPFLTGDWRTVTLHFVAGSTVEVNCAKDSFWNGTCRELIARDIGRWFIDLGLAPWPKGRPPRFSMSPTRYWRVPGRAPAGPGLGIATQRRRQGKTMAELVYVDNSNVFIEGKRVMAVESGRAEHL